MPVGWGNEPPGRGPRGFRSDVPPPVASDALEAIRRRYYGAPTLQPQVFSLTANQTVRFDLTGQAVNAIILTTMTGQVNGYFGDNTNNSGNPATVPHFVGSAAVDVNTIVIPVTPGENYIITLQEGAAATTTGCITFEYQ